eukprot:2741526-Rhodomonas_salina.4
MRAKIGGGGCERGLNARCDTQHTHASAPNPSSRGPTEPLLTPTLRKSMQEPANSMCKSSDLLARFRTSRHCTPFVNFGRLRSSFSLRGPTFQNLRFNFRILLRGSNFGRILLATFSGRGRT